MPGTSGAGSSFRFRTVGAFAVWRDGERLAARDLGSRKGRTVLKLLLTNPDEPVAVDRIVEVLWGEHAPDRAERNVASLVSRLRSLLGTDTIEGAGGAYVLLTGERLEIDVVEAARLADEAAARLAAREPALAAAAARRGLDLVGDDPTTLLAEEPDADWAEPARAALLRLRRRLRRAAWEAASELGDARTAAQQADAALVADPYDEEACRASMRAHHALGRTAEALRVYERLRATLSDELGADPSAPTQDAHRALLRGEPPAQASSRTPDVVQGVARPVPVTFVGRDEELAELHRHWVAATTGRPGLVLVTGEAGIGKTTLAEQLLTTAHDTGGVSLRARCYATERSLFLAPIVEVLTGLAARIPPEVLRDAVAPWAGTMAELVPGIAAVVGPQHHEPSTADVERRRTFQAIASLLRQVSADRPVLVLLDDLHNAGAASIELLHHLIRHVTASRLLVVATVRVEEGTDALRELAAVGERLDVGPLSDDAVTSLVRAAGVERFTPRIVSMTRGHTLSVVETLAALAEAGDDAGELPVPASLKVAVLQRVEYAGAEVAELLRAAAVLGSTFDLRVAAALLDLPVEDSLRRAEHAVVCRLLVEDGARFAFSNDLVQEIVYQTTPAPTRALRHQRAAELLDGQPEAVGWHARAAGDWPRALEAWLEAADQAARRYATRDAEELLDRAIEAAQGADDPVGVARARLARALVRYTSADYVGALDDLEAAADLARANARPDLEAAALRQLGGDVIVGLGRPSTDCLPYLEVGLDVAQSARLGTIEVELMGRIAVVWSNRARFDLAAEVAERALARARELDDDRAVALALDAVKNVSAYTGDLERLAAVLPELERILRPDGDLALLQWCVFESMMPLLADARWDAAALVLDRALALNRRTGHPWGSLFVAHRSWLHRAQGRYGQAIADAEAAGEERVAAGHPWWRAFSDAMLGWVLSDTGAQDEAIAALQEGVSAAERDGMETYLVRCSSHLALAHWRRGDTSEAARHLERTERLLAGVRTPPGRAFLHGAHAYTAAARVRLGRGEVGAATRLLDVVAPPARAIGWREIVVTDDLLRGRCELVSGRLAEAGDRLRSAVEGAEESGLLPLAWEARTALAHLAARTDDGEAVGEHGRAAARHLEVIAASLDDAGRRAQLLDAADRRRTAASGEVSG